MGILSGLKQAAKAIEEASNLATAEDRAKAIATAAAANKAQTPIKASEAFGNLNLEGQGVVGLTQADRTRVGGSTAGGPLFSTLQLHDPKYAEAKATWGVRDKPTASRLINESNPSKVWTTMLGAEDQLKTNPVVFDQLYRAFGQAVKRGDVEPEKVEQINELLRQAGYERADITNPKFKQTIADSFQARALVADLFQNIGIGGPQKSFGPEAKSILIKNTEPSLLHPEHGGDAPTFAAGPRIFSLDKTVSMRPDLNAGFPAILGGEDLGVSFAPVPNQTFLPDFWDKIMQSTGKEPGYMHLTRGIKGEGLPSQQITEDWLTHLQNAGYAEGGSVGLTPEEQVAMHQEAEKHFGIGGAVLKAAKALAEPVDRLAMGFKDVTQRTPILQEAAQALDRGELTAEQYAALVNQYKPVTPYASVPQPASPEEALNALTKPKQAMYGKTAEIPAGAKADLRLDIPAYANHGVWVNSVHQADKPTVYGATSAAKNVTMKAPANKALAVAKGGPKAPFATMSGEWNPMTTEEAFAKAQEYIDHPEWSQIGFDPERHGYFYDRETMEPVTHADEVIQVGPLVLARGAKHIPPEEGHKYAAGGMVLKAAENLSKLFHAAPEAVKAAKVAEYVDPATQKIGDWAWRDLPSVNKDVGLTEVPDYIQGGYGQFMKDQNARAAAGQMNPRDFTKAYTTTRSSVNRGGLSHASATRTGMQLPNTGELVRPEGAYAEWLGSKMGQKYLDEAEQGNVHMPAIHDLVSRFEPFGMAPKLGDDMIWAALHGQDAIPDVNALVTAPVDEYRDLIQSVPGIGPAKSGFVASLLGRGDLPTFDARQIRLQTGQGGKEAAKYMSRGNGLGGDEAVDRLAARQRAMDLGIDPALDPFYQHLTHHAIWDKVAGSETTHDDLVKAMRGYADGGTVEGSK